jgi:tyrosinase
MLRVDKDRVIRAILKMKEAPDTFQKYSDWHHRNMAVAHMNLNFLAWHRIFLILFEKDMVAADIARGNDGRIGLPYWNWAVDNSPDPTTTNSTGWLWRSEEGGLHIGVGPNGVDNGSGEVDGNYKVEDGAFKEGPDWVVSAPGAPAYIRRKLNELSVPSQAHIDRALELTDFDTGDMDRDSGLTSSFRNVLEGYASNHSPPQLPGLHNRIHIWVGGRYSSRRVTRRPGTLSLTPIAPNDPVFFFHHANIDRIWAIWQERHRTRPQYPSPAAITAARASTPHVKQVDENMPPWDGSAGTSAITAQDVLSTTSLGGPFTSADNYRYKAP